MKWKDSEELNRLVELVKRDLEKPMLVGGKLGFIPERMHNGIINHVVFHTECGSFLTAVLDNDLAKAVMCADSENIALIPFYVSFLNNAEYVPAVCWGSKEKVTEWLKQRDELRTSEGETSNG